MLYRCTRETQAPYAEQTCARQDYETFCEKVGKIWHFDTEDDFKSMELHKAKFLPSNLQCDHILELQWIQGVIKQDKSASEICGEMAVLKAGTLPKASPLTRNQQAILNDARDRFQKIVLSSDNLVFVTGEINRGKANYNRPDDAPQYNLSKCVDDKTRNIEALRVYMEGVKIQAGSVASQLAKLFEDTNKQVYSKQVTLNWAAKIDSGIASAQKQFDLYLREGPKTSSKPKRNWVDVLLRRAKTTAPVQGGCAASTSLTSQGPSSTLRSATLRPTATSIRPSSSLISSALPPTRTALRPSSMVLSLESDEQHSTSLPKRPTSLSAQNPQPATPTRIQFSRPVIPLQQDSEPSPSLTKRPSMSAQVLHPATPTHPQALSPNTPPEIDARPSISPAKTPPLAKTVLPAAPTLRQSSSPKLPSSRTRPSPRPLTVGKGKGGRRLRRAVL